jgi:hypothetical protein
MLRVRNLRDLLKSADPLPRRVLPQRLRTKSAGARVIREKR